MKPTHKLILFVTLCNINPYKNKTFSYNYEVSLQKERKLFSFSLKNHSAINNFWSSLLMTMTTPLHWSSFCLYQIVTMTILLFIFFTCVYWWPWLHCWSSLAGLTIEFHTSSLVQSKIFIHLKFQTKIIFEICFDLYSKSLGLL